MKKLIYILVLFISIVSSGFAITKEQSRKACLNHLKTYEGSILLEMDTIYKNCMVAPTFKDINIDARQHICLCVKEKITPLAGAFTKGECDYTIEDIKKTIGHYPNAEELNTAMYIVFGMAMETCKAMFGYK